MLQEMTIDLRRPPMDRWHFTPTQQAQAIELLHVYKADLGVQQETHELLASSTRNLISGEHWAEIESVSRAFGIPLQDILLCNVYYDILKLVLGCTAFAIASPGGILHARNLDWWTPNGILGRYSTICHFVGGSSGPFSTIGWPGFIGAFSGVATGRFAISLNAVLSSDPPALAQPISFVLRKVLEEAGSFAEAEKFLREAPLASDCLLLITGTKPGELAVIERTPSRSAIRKADVGSSFVCVANDFRALQANHQTTLNELAATSCHRFDRVKKLLEIEPPENAGECLNILTDDQVRMQCTVQQMVLNAATGQIWLDLPSASQEFFQCSDLTEC